MTQEFTLEEIAQHNSKDDLWIVINNKVYDLTKFARVHPGGAVVLHQVAGTDCTEQFYALHQEQVLTKYGPKFFKGTIKGAIITETLSKGDLSLVPYGEPSAFMKGFHSPYYNQTHKDFRLAVRQFFAEHVKQITQILPHSDEWEENATTPTIELQQKMGSFGLLACCIYPSEYQKHFTLPGNIKQFDYFHELICHQEFFRIGAPGVSDSLKTGLSIGLPPVMKMGHNSIRDRVVLECLSGKKRVVLAISDPDAGSDVAGLTCVAHKSDCGKFYIVNGTKKWITNGTYADYFVTAVRTGKKGTKGISMLLIERSEGLTTKLIKTSYSPAAGTAYVEYVNVKVPIEHLLGEENKGFELIMSNFNHERWMMACQVVAASRSVVEQCFKWVNQRETFGKKLVQQPVIRQKLGLMVAQVEACESWLETITYQMQHMSDKEQYNQLGGPIALLKLQCTRMSQFISDQACQIFGGRAITRTGMGMYIERFQKSFKFTAIYGGSEEIMADLGIKQAMRFFPKQARL